MVTWSFSPKSEVLKWLLAIFVSKKCPQALLGQFMVLKKMEHPLCKDLVPLIVWQAKEDRTFYFQEQNIKL